VTSSFAASANWRDGPVASPGTSRSQAYRHARVERVAGPGLGKVHPRRDGGWATAFAHELGSASSA
jgi:hypothetical protein